jgi:predicted AAA+ superfamily ATPase
MELDRELAAQLKRVLSSLEQLLPNPVDRIDWKSIYAANWHRHSFAGFLEPLEAIEGIRLDDLLGIDSQKRAVEENTRQFLAGYPANNTLLWGTRGTGKSSLVRALLNRYAADGLRVVQVDKDDLVHLPDIVAEIKDHPYKFIVFSDDLSFETGESSYKMLKSALDGSVYAPPPNVLIYVTSNRRHLLPEYESDNRGAMMVNNEIHHGEAIEEKISLSGRFGLWVGFHPFSQDQYLK